jgi:hypothetical protein
MPSVDVQRGALLSSSILREYLHPVFQERPQQDDGYGTGEQECVLGVAAWQPAGWEGFSLSS